MDDDFNTGGALGELFELVRALNRYADAETLEARKDDPAALATFDQRRGRRSGSSRDCSASSCGRPSTSPRPRPAS